MGPMQFRNSALSHPHLRECHNSRSAGSNAHAKARFWIFTQPMLQTTRKPSRRIRTGLFFCRPRP